MMQIKIPTRTATLALLQSVVMKNANDTMERPNKKNVKNRTPKLQFLNSEKSNAMPKTTVTRELTKTREEFVTSHVAQ
jgi:hypothetical protein